MSDLSEQLFLKTDATTIFRMAGDDLDTARLVCSLFGSAGGCPGSNLSALPQLLSHLSRDRPLKLRTIALVRDLLLDAIDQKIQKNVYKYHFACHPPSFDMTHEERIAALETTKPAAQEIINSYDWDELADFLQLDLIGEDAKVCVQRLSNFAFPVQRVNFRFTYHCNIGCRHCYNSSGPDKKTQIIQLDDMLRIVTQMPDAGISSLNISGGEPFLYPREVSALIAAGRLVGLHSISLYTNGFWATSDERTERILEELWTAGFMFEPGDSLKVSAGIYHQEFIPFINVLRIARVYHGMFGRRLRVDFETNTTVRDAEGDIRLKVRSANCEEYIQLSFRYVTAVGRGRDVVGISRHKINGSCKSINQIVFDPDGVVRPCCGFNSDNQGIAIGSMRTYNLKELIKRMQNDPVLQLLSRDSMDVLFKYMGKQINPFGYTGICEACQDAIGLTQGKERIQKKLFGIQSFYPFWFDLPNRHAVG